MLNRSASLAMSTSILKAFPGKLDIKRHSPSILYVYILLIRLFSGLYFFCHQIYHVILMSLKILLDENQKLYIFML